METDERLNSTEVTEGLFQFRALPIINSSSHSLDEDIPTENIRRRLSMIAGSERPVVLLSTGGLCPLHRYNKIYLIF